LGSTNITSHIPNLGAGFKLHQLYSLENGPSYPMDRRMCALQSRSVTNFMELRLLEKPPVMQLLKNFPTFYGSRKVHYRVHKSPLLVPILSQMNPVRIAPSYLFKMTIPNNFIYIWT
jgi:hypothetical protein